MKIKTTFLLLLSMIGLIASITVISNSDQPFIERVNAAQPIDYAHTESCDDCDPDNGWIVRCDTIKSKHECVQQCLNCAKTPCLTACPPPNE